MQFSPTRNKITANAVNMYMLHKKTLLRHASLLKPVRKTTRQFSKSTTICAHHNDDIFYDLNATNTNEKEHGFQRDEFKTEKVSNTVKPSTTKEVFLHTGIPSTEWPADIRQIESVALIFDHLKKLQPKIFITDATREDREEGSFDCLVYPDAVTIKDIDPLNKSHLEFVGNFLSNSKDVSSSSSSGGSSKTGEVSVLDRTDDVTIFICCHHARDLRCSHCGPQLFKTFYETINSEEVKQRLLSLSNAGNKRTVNVFRVSHVGGHKFAGNVVVYEKKKKQEVEGVESFWYGYVSPQDVQAIIDKHVFGVPSETLQALLRGQTFSNSQ